MGSKLHAGSVIKKTQMKKLLYVLALIIATNTSCKKSEDETPSPTTPTDTTNNNNNNGNNNSTVPTSFTQKVLIEMFTSAAYGTCPDGLTKLESATAANPNKIIPVCIHDADGMSIPQTFNYTSTFGVSSYASGMTNRTPSLSNIMLQPSQFSSNTSVALGKIAKCGLEISSTLSGTTATINVNAGFKDTINGTFNLTVYLVEEEVTGTGSMYDQKNNYNTSSGSPYYNMGNPMINFKHNHVLRKVLSTQAMGDEIPSTSIKAQGLYQKSFVVEVGSYNSTKLSIIAFVNRAGTNTSACEILNAQTAKLGSEKNWD